MGYIVGIVVFIIAVLHNPNDPNKNVGKLKSNLGIEKKKGFGNLGSKSLNSNLFSKTKITKAEIEAFKLVTGWYGEFDVCKLADDGVLPWDEDE